MDIVWLGEMWVNAGHTVSKGWSDNSVQGTRKGRQAEGVDLLFYMPGYHTALLIIHFCSLGRKELVISMKTWTTTSF